MSVVIAGSTGLVGSALTEVFTAAGHEVIGLNRSVVDLLDLEATKNIIRNIKPNLVIDAAAKVGGIGANNTLPVEFLSNNLRIQSNLMDAAHAASVEKFVFLGSSCIYPRDCQQPIKEEYLMTGPLEATNSAYAIAKIAGIELINSYRKEYGAKWISLMPTNLYGPRDNFDLNEGHALPAMIHRFHLAKIAGENVVEIWGDGTPLREFLFVEDLARACLLLLEEYDEDVAINVGSGSEVTIKQLAEIVSKVVEFKGEIVFRSDLPNGSPRKILDSSRINNLGWSPQMNLGDGISSTYRWFTSNYKNIRGKLD